MKAENKNVKETAKTAVKNATEAAKSTASAAKAAAKNAKTVEKAVEKTVEKTAASLEKKAEKTVKAAEKTVKAAEKAVKDTTIRKTSVKETVYLQYLGKEINKDDLVKKVQEIWTGEMNRKASEFKNVTLYLKPEENAAYYVINGEVTGRIAL